MDKSLTKYLFDAGMDVDEDSSQSLQEAILNLDPYNDDDDFDKMYERLNAGLKSDLKNSTEKAEPKKAVLSLDSYEDDNPDKNRKGPERNSNDFITKQNVCADSGFNKPHFDLRQHLDKKKQKSNEPPKKNPPARMPKLVPANSKNYKRQGQWSPGGNNKSGGFNAAINNTANLPGVTPGHMRLPAVLGNATGNSIMGCCPNHLGALNSFSSSNCVPLTFGINPLCWNFNGFGFNGMGINTFGIGVNSNALSGINLSNGVGQNGMAINMPGLQVGRTNTNGNIGHLNATGHSINENNNNRERFNLNRIRGNNGRIARQNEQISNNIKRSFNMQSKLNSNASTKNQNSKTVASVMGMDQDKVNAEGLPAVMSLLQKIMNNGITIQMAQNNKDD